MIGKSAFAKRFRQEMPELVAQGFLDREAAERILAHYEDARGANRFLLFAFGVLGALLIGGGVILLLAHNWEHLGRFTRAALSVAPMMICQGLAFWAARTGRRGGTWGEGVGIAWNLCTAAGIALISQTYHMGGTFHDFLLVWSLMSLPIPYLTGSLGAALLWVSGWLCWLPEARLGDPGWLFWPVYALILPYLLATMAKARESARAAVAAQILFWSLALGGAMSHEYFSSPLRFSLFLTLVAASSHLAGRIWFSDSASAWKNPLRTLGAEGVALAVFVLSFADVWPELIHGGGTWHEASQLTGEILLPLFALAWGGLLYLSWRRGDKTAFVLGFAPLVILGAYALFVLLQTTFAPALLVNLYGLAAGLWIICQATREQSIKRLNGGMALIAGLAVLRFFDMEFSLLTRGTAFILIGAALLAVNTRVIRNRRV